VRRLAKVCLSSGLVALLCLWAGGCATGPVTWQPGNLQPLTVGWQQFFRIQWDATTYAGQPAVEGYVTNVFGFTALNVRLLVNGYDASGQQVGQLISWGPNEIDYGGRVYFIVPVPAAATYDVSIFSWTWVQTGNGGDMR
jgi:hypothetical protein